MNAIKIALALMLVCPSSWAADPTVPASPQLERKSFPAEAADAVFGRVFGAEDQKPGIDYHVIDLTQRTAGNAALRSALVPGWGQSFNGESGKGALLFGTTAAFGVGALYSYSKARDKHQEYERIGQKSHSTYDDYSKLQTLAWALAGGAAILWSYSIYDAATGTGRSTYGRNTSVNLTMGPDQAELLWQKKF